MTSARDEQKSATRSGILDAAIQVFAKLGYDGSSFREITALCGAKRSLILYHFDSKEALWQTAAEEVERRFNIAFEAVFTGEPQSSDRETARHALACFVDALCEVPEYGQIYLREGATSGPRMEWLAHHFVPRRAIAIQFQDPSIEERLRTTVLRDILACTLVAFVTLGPLLDRSHAVATRQSSTGVYPLSAQKRAELVDYLMKLIF